MSILTLATYKALTNTTVNTYDTLIGNLLPVAQKNIETYCDRLFDSTRYYQWFHFNYDRLVVLPEYPVQQIVFVGYPALVATATIATGSYNIEVTSTGVTVTNDANFAQDTYNFNPNDTLLKLKTEIEDDYPGSITIAIDPSYTNMNSLLLRSGSGREWTGAVRLDCQVRKQDRSDRIMEFAYDSAFVFSYANDYIFNDELYVIWNAGYDYADMPKDLQMIEANIIRDYLNIITGNINPLIKKQTITNYSIEYVDSNLLNNVVDNYKSQLDNYLKKIL